MKTVALKSLLLVAIGLVLSFTAFGQPTEVACNRALSACLGQCNTTRDRVVAGNARQRSDVVRQLARDLNDCADEHSGDKPAIATCQQPFRDAAAEQLRRLRLLDIAAEAARSRCIDACRTARANCPQFTANVGELEVSDECLPGGPPCFHEVSKLCQQISGACEACGFSMCGGGDWTFEAEVPLVVTLLAGTDPLTNPRVLATSTLRGKQAVLNVPPDIKLGAGEQLYLSVRSPEKPGRAVKVAIRRDQK